MQIFGQLFFTIFSHFFHPKITQKWVIFSSQKQALYRVPEKDPFFTLVEGSLYGTQNRPILGLYRGCPKCDHLPRTKTTLKLPKTGPSTMTQKSSYFGLYRGWCYESLVEPGSWWGATRATSGRGCGSSGSWWSTMSSSMA